MQIFNEVFEWVIASTDKECGCTKLIDIEGTGHLVAKNEVEAKMKVAMMLAQDGLDLEGREILVRPFCS